MKRAESSKLPDNDLARQKDLVRHKLHKELTLWKKLRKAAPFCLAAALSFFVTTGGVEKSAHAGDVYINYEQQRDAYRPDPTNSPTYWAWGTWYDITPGYRYDSELQAAINAVISSGGGTAHLSDSVTPGHTNTALGSGGRQYQSNWGSTIYAATLTVTNTTAVPVVLQDDRSTMSTSYNYVIETLSKSGNGTFTLEGLLGRTSYSSTTLSGTDGVLQINVNYTSATANVGGTTLQGFQGSVGAGATWTATTLNASNTFRKQDVGALVTTTSNITGDSYMEGGTWSANTLNVAQGAAGNLTVTNGTLTAVKSNVGNTHAGKVTVDGVNAIWNTTNVDIGIGGTGDVVINNGAWNVNNVTNIGHGSNGTVKMYGGTWDSVTTNVGNLNEGLVEIAGGTWTANGITQIGLGDEGTVTLTNSGQGTWISKARTDVGVNDEGTVNIHGGTWDATGQDVRIGLQADGTVNQTAGTWSNRVTDVGVNGGNGYVNQSGGTHNDTMAYIGHSSYGEYNLSGIGTEWNTSGTSPNGSAQIGVDAGVKGVVNVSTQATWTVDNALTVAVNGTGELNISVGGVTDVVNGDVIIGRNTGSLGHVTVTDNNSLLQIQNGNLTVAYAGNNSILDVLAGGMVDVQTGYATIGRNQGVTGTVNVDGNNSHFRVESDLYVGENGNGYLNITDFGKTEVVTGNAIIGKNGTSYGEAVIDGTGSTFQINTGNLIVAQSGNNSKMEVLDGGLVDVQTGSAIIGQNSNVHGSVLVDGANSHFRIEQDLIVAESGTAELEISDGGKTEVLTGNAIIGKNTGSYGEVSVHDPDSVLQVNTGNLVVAQNGNNSRLDISNGGLVDVQTGDAIIGQEAGVTGYVTVTDMDSELRVKNDLVVGDKGIGYLDVDNAGAVNVDRDMVIARQADSEGVAKFENQSTLDVTRDLITGQGKDANGLLLMYTGSTGTVGGDHIISDTKDAHGRDLLTDSYTRLDVVGTTIVGNAGQAGLRYRHPQIGTPANDDPTDGWKAEMVNYIGNSLNPENAPGLVISDGAVMTSDNGVVGNQKGSYGYVVIDNLNGTATRATWDVDTQMTVANAGDAYLRVLNGGLLEAGAMTIAAGNGTDKAEGTVRVNGVRSNGERSTLIVDKGDLIVAENNRAEGNLYVYDEANMNVVVGNMIIADKAGSYGRAHFDGDRTTGTVADTLIVGNAGQAGQRYQYVDSNGVTAGYANLGDPTSWYDTDQTLDSLRTGTAVRNNMPGLLISDGAVVKSGSGSVGDDVGGYGYVVIDNNNGTATRASWIITDTVNGSLAVGNLGDAYLRVLNGGLLQTDDGINMTIGAGDGTTTNTGTVRVNGIKDNGQRSTLDVGGILTVADETGTNGNLYIYDKAKGDVALDMVIAAEEGSNGRAHIDGYGTTLDVEQTLVVGLSGNAGKKYEYIPGKYPENGKDAADPDVWFDSAQTLNPLTGNFSQNNAPGLLISDAAVVTSYDGMIGQTDTAVGYVVIDGRLSTANGRTTWHVENDLTVADEGFAYVRVNHGALLKVDNDLITAKGEGEGTIRVYGVNANGTASQLNVDGNMITANEGEGNFYLYDKANSTVQGNYTIAAEADSHGRAQIDGNGTWMRVEETVTVGQYGQAGGVHNGASGAPNPADPAHWFDSQNTLVDLNGASNLLANAPGLAITAGGKLSSGYGVAAEFAGSNGYMVIDGKDAGTGRSWWKVDKDMNFGQAGNAYGRVFNGALLEVGTDGGGNMIIADEGTATSTLDVYGSGTELLVHGNLTTAKQAGSRGNLYLFNQATAVIDNDHIIADEAGSLGRDYVDGAGTTMTVVGMLTVANAGQAGGTYTENRYDPRYGGISGKFADGDPAVWFDAPERTMDLVSAVFAQTDNTTGNTPGLAITRGAQVFSGSGMVGNVAGSSGYVVIDNKGNTDTVNDPKTRTMWQVSATALGDGNLAIANAGTAFVRVLNGALLETDSLTMNEGGGDGTLHVIGNGAKKDEDGNYAKDENGRFIPELHDGYRTEWINHGAAAIGLSANGGIGAIRINDGAYAETHGLYIAVEEGSQGAVSVKGAASELHVYEDVNSQYAGSIPAGSATLSVSDWAYVHMHENSVIKLNGNAMFSNGAILHLDANSLVDAMTDRVSFVNARVEGIGTVTGQKGVFITQDDIFTPEGQAEIDPGMSYGWSARCDESELYGTLTFGDQLIMSGDVYTYFDISRGFSNVDPAIPPQQDLIVVKRGTSPNSATVTEDPIIAELSGTLKVHARLTDYYEKDSSFMVVKTEGDSRTGEFVAGRILTMYDNLEVLPSRFFNDIGQVILQDNLNNDQLWVNMERKDNPFEEAGITYNQQQTGKGLDSIYAEQHQDWLPFLRYFWYLEDPEFLNAYKMLSGEVRAHSMMMALRSPWRYIQDRVDTNRSCFDSYHSPCDQIEEELTCRPWRKRLDGVRLWGSYIYEDENMGSDGNASGYDLRRNGLAVGADYQLKNTKTYFGVMFAYDDGKLTTLDSRAESDDFNIGLYHKSRFQNGWEWKNYLGMGYQDYDMWRDVTFGLSHMDWNGSKYECTTRDDYGGRLKSAFKGYSFAASTELGKTFIRGCHNQHQFRPYVALDLMGTRQRAASETGNFEYSRYVALNFNKASDMRVYFRPGLSWERGGPKGVLRAQVAYSFLIGGHSYARAKNQFQYGGDAFNIRSVDDGIGYVSLNLGTGLFLDRMKTSMATFDYWLLGGEHSTTHALQLGVQKKF